MTQQETVTSSQSPSNVTILMVDDEPNVLAGFRRLIGRKWNLQTAESGAAALALIRMQGPFAVVVTDMQMPNMNGVELLEQVHTHSSDTVCIMLTGNADQQTAIQAINRGHVFQFLNKPCTPEVLEQAIARAMRQYELITAEKVLLKGTLSGVIRLLIEALCQSRPKLASVTSSIRRSTETLGEFAGVGGDWQLNLASSLCLIGLSVMRDIGDDDIFLEENLVECAECGSRLLGHIPRLAAVAQLVKRQRENLSFPSGSELSAISGIEASMIRVLRLAVDIERVRQGAIEQSVLLDELRSDQSIVAKKVLPLVQGLLGAGEVTENKQVAPASITRLPITRLKEGMIVEENIVANDGRTILVSGFQLTSFTVERLRSYAMAGSIPSEVCVRWPTNYETSAAA